MKMLLTSAGVMNPSIHAALVSLLPKPIEECNALCIPTPIYAHPLAGPVMAYSFFNNTAGNPMLELGWKQMGVLELTVLPHINRELWVPLIENADVLLVAGGETMFLAHWMRESGLAEMLPKLDIVWVSLSAGSVVMAPHIGKRFVFWPEEGADDTGLGFVDFAIFPHLDYPTMPTHSLEHAKEWFTHMHVPGYAIDDETAIKVNGDEIEVISEGNWHYWEHTS